MFFSQFASAGLRGGDCELFKKRFRLDVAKFSFSSWVVDNWNCLSAPGVNSGTINTFNWILYCAVFYVPANTV